MAKVFILGAGMGGLSDAHELLEPNCEVNICQAAAVPGGKVRSGIHPSGVGLPTEGTAPLKNSRPLLVNEVNSHQYRPDGQTKMPNLLLASDYVLTHTDLTTMEGVDEAGRRAVCAILQQDNLPNSPMEKPAEFDSLEQGDNFVSTEWFANHPNADHATVPEQMWDILKSMRSPHPDNLTRRVQSRSVSVSPLSG